MKADEAKAETTGWPGPTEGPSAAPFRVGGWWVEPALYRISRGDGQVANLEPKVMEVLLCLRAAAPNPVPGDELLRRVWGTPHLSEDLPRRAVYELRKVFGDDARRPAMIETIPRAGYRWIARENPEAPAVPEVPPGRRGFGPLARPAAAAAAAVALVLLTWWLSRPSSPAHRSQSPGDSAAAPLQLVPLTSQPGLEYDPAVSPDGRRVAFLRAPSSAVDGEIALMVKPLTSEPALRLTAEPADFDHPLESPTWSPDGERLAFLRWRRGLGWAVFTISALGGAERRVAELSSREVSGLAWSPDGAWLALALGPASGEPTGPRRLHRLAADGSRLEPLAEAPPPNHLGDRLPAWSPDGGRLAFVRESAEGAAEVRWVDASGGASTRIAGGLRLADLDWHADGRHLLLSAYADGRYRLHSLGLEDGNPRPLPAGGHDLRWLSVARNTGELVAANARYEVGVRRLEVATGVVTPLPALSSTHYDEALDVSPDGSRLAFVSTRSGNAELWISDFEGHRPLRLTHFDGATVGHPRWLPDGRGLVFESNAQGSFDLWQVDAEGGPPRALTSGPTSERAPGPSPDGRTVAFTSDRSGRFELWTMPAGGGEPQQRTAHSGHVSRFSADGRWLYFTRFQEDGLWRLEVDGKGAPERVLATEPKSWEGGNWTLAADRLWVVVRGAGNQVFLGEYSLAGQPLRALPIPGTPIRPSLALLPDGSGLLYAELERVESDLVRVEGWGGRR